MEQPVRNPRMPLTTKGILYAFGLVALAILTAYFVIRGLKIRDDDAQYAVTIGLIALFVGLFFTRDDIHIDFWRRAVLSFVMAAVAFLILMANGLFFEYFFCV